VAVFRFTLGIPGFPDEDIPSAVGALGLAATAANHLSVGFVPPGMARCEALGVALALACFGLPFLKRAVVASGRGGTAAAREVPGAREVLALDPARAASEHAELAWASYALLRNTDACSVLAVDPAGRVAVARGAFASTALVGVPPGSRDPAALCEALGAAWAEGLGDLRALAGAGDAGGGEVRLDDRLAMTASGAYSLPLVPGGARQLLAVPAGARGDWGDGGLLLMSDVSEGLGTGDAAWARALGVKIAGTLGGGDRTAPPSNP